MTDAPAHLNRRAALALLGCAAAPAWAYPGPLSWSTTRIGPGLRPQAQPVLPPDVASALQASGLPLGSFGLHAVPVAGAGLALASVNAELHFQLASTAKLVTSLAAIDLLGPGYRWRTFAFLTGPLVEGRLMGDLLIVGGGDASLTALELRAWFASMVAKGLTEVMGDIVIDRFAFRLHEDDHANTPTPTPTRPHHARPDAMTVDEGVLKVSLVGDAGSRPGLSLSPALPGLKIVNEVAPGRRCSAWVQLDDHEGQSRLVARGQWAVACGTREVAQLAMPHEEFSVRAVAGLWRDAGGRLRGRVLDEAGAPRETLHPRGADGRSLQPWAVHRSNTLATVLRGINKHSDNLAARHLMLSLTRDFPIRPATLPGARARVSDWLRRQGLAAGDIEVGSGAGLSRTERGKPRAMAHLLRNAWHAKQSRLFVDSLPVAGVDGTLSARMVGGAAEGRAFLKTGSLHDTRALAGYVRAQSGRVHALALIVNHPDAAKASPTLDALVEWVVRAG